MSETGSVLKGDPRIEKQRWSRRLSLTSLILFVNVLPLVLLGGGVIYVDAYRKQLLDERFKLALFRFREAGRECAYEHYLLSYLRVPIPPRHTLREPQCDSPLDRCPT